MSAHDQPTALPEPCSFKYLLIPCEDLQSVQSLHFTGNGEADLKRQLEDHFASKMLSDGQRAAFRTALSERIDDNAKKQVSAAGGTVLPPSADSEQMQKLISESLFQQSYEIVPVEMPSYSNNFIGTSLYIDDSGRFKDLMVNTRASRLVGRDIRGDAFLLSNHDDPALDTWERVDCTEVRYKELCERNGGQGPQTYYDSTNTQQMAELAFCREKEAVRVSEKEAASALKSRADGNSLVSCADFKGAAQAYSVCIDITSGRIDLLPNYKELEQAKIASYLNRSLCLLKTGDFYAAKKDAIKVCFDLNKECVKGWFRLASAQLRLKECEEARKSLDICESLYKKQCGDSAGSLVELTQLRQELRSCMEEIKRQEKARYISMLAQRTLMKPRVPDINITADMLVIPSSYVNVECDTESECLVPSDDAVGAAAKYNIEKSRQLGALLQLTAATDATLLASRAIVKCDEANREAEKFLLAVEKMLKDIKAHHEHVLRDSGALRSCMLKQLNGPSLKRDSELHNLWERKRNSFIDNFNISLERFMTIKYKLEARKIAERRK